MQLKLNVRFFTSALNPEARDTDDEPIRFGLLLEGNEEAIGVELSLTSRSLEGEQVITVTTLSSNPTISVEQEFFVTKHGKMIGRGKVVDVNH